MLAAINDYEVTEKKYKFELADIFRMYGEQYQKAHFLPLAHKKILQDIIDCRTSAMGGHRYQCDCEDCKYEEIHYDSCRNRHCPKCQTMHKEKWISARKAELLPVSYYHLVFTLPHELNGIAGYNKKVMYDLLFQAVSKTLLAFGKDPAYLGGKTGFLAILHTWTQTLLEHIHLHVVLPAFAISQDGKKGIYPKKKKILYPVKALSKKFQGLFLHLFNTAIASGALLFEGNIESYNDPQIVNDLKKNLWKKDWIVYAKKPFAGPTQVLSYLGRYTHKVAISNHRIMNVENGFVTFKYRDRKDQNKEKLLTLPAEEFIRRFFLHALPLGFVRIRHFGFLSNKNKSQNIKTCRRLLGVTFKPSDKQSEKSALNTLEILKIITGKDITLCPKCKKGTLLFVGLVERLNARIIKLKNSFLNSSL